MSWALTTRKPLDALGDAFWRFLRRAPRQERSRATVDAMVQALEERLALGENLDDITIEALSDRAGVGSGSFYEYFVSKDSVLGVLLGRLTHRNFVELAAQLERGEHANIDAHIREFAASVAQTYYARPGRLRALVLGIGKLGLLDVVTGERDRFAQVIAKTAKRYLPHADDAELHRTFVLIGDAAMGIMASESLRSSPAPLSQIVDELATVGSAIVHRRHSR